MLVAEGSQLSPSLYLPPPRRGPRSHCLPRKSISMTDQSGDIKTRPPKTGQIRRPSRFQSSLWGWWWLLFWPFSFLNCACLLPPLRHGRWSQEHSPMSFLPTDLHLGVCFQGNHSRQLEIHIWAGEESWFERERFGKEDGRVGEGDGRWGARWVLGNEGLHGGAGKGPLRVWQSSGHYVLVEGLGKLKNVEYQYSGLKM